MTDEARIVEVRMIGVPVSAYRESAEHIDELLREFALVDTDNGRAIPRRLVELMDRLKEQFGGYTTEQELALQAASERGQETIDLVYYVPVEAKKASIELGVMLEEADEFCREGSELLTLTTPPRALAFRRWFLDQFVRQVEGLDPAPWEEPSA